MSSDHTGRKLHIGGEMAARDREELNMIADNPTD